MNYKKIKLERTSSIFAICMGIILLFGIIVSVIIIDDVTSLLKVSKNLLLTSLLITAVFSNAMLFTGLTLKKNPFSNIALENRNGYSWALFFIFLSLAVMQGLAYNFLGVLLFLFPAFLEGYSLTIKYKTNINGLPLDDSGVIDYHLLYNSFDEVYIKDELYDLLFIGLISEEEYNKVIYKLENGDYFRDI